MLKMLRADQTWVVCRTLFVTVKNSLPRALATQMRELGAQGSLWKVEE